MQAVRILRLRNLQRREQTSLGRQRLTLLLFCYLPMLVVGIMANFLGITQPSAPFFNYTHLALLVATFVFLVLYFGHKISIGLCLAAFTVIAQVIISVEMIYSAFHPTNYYLMLIMADIVLLTMNMMISIAASMKINTLMLGVSTLAVYVACSFLSGDAVMQSFIVVFIAAFSLASFVGVWLAKSINKIEAENEQMRKEELDLQHILRLKWKEVNAFISLASEKHSHDGIKVLMERLDSKAMHCLLANVENYILTRKTDIDLLSSAFPEFTPSEIEICRLILQGKKLNDICATLNKNESNINSQRANMRRKLGLKPTDNLQTALQQRLDKA